jgi:RND family efflux transporter MFP subunit
VTIQTEGQAPVDLARLRIDRDAGPRRPWLLWAVLAALAVAAAAGFPAARAYLAERQAPEVDVVRAAELAAARPGGSAALPVLVASGYVVARHSSDVGVKVGGRLARVKFEEGTHVRKGEVIAEIEHADVDAQLEASRRAVAEADAQLAQAIAARDEDVRNLERQRALMKDGITTTASLTAAESASLVSGARVKSAEAAIASARARVRVADEALENTNVRAPFDGVVIKKRTEVGETVSPFGVAGQAAREGGAIATIADLRELEVQTEVSENSVAKLAAGMPAEVTLQAYQNQAYRATVRQIFPSADRAKAIVEVRVSILNPDAHVKPEMTASVTFQEPAVGRAQGPTTPTRIGVGPESGQSRTGVGPELNRSGSDVPVVMVMVPRRAVTELHGQPAVWVVTRGTASHRAVALGAERLDQVELKSGVMPGDMVILNPPPTLTDGTLVRVKGS